VTFWSQSRKRSVGRGHPSLKRRAIWWQCLMKLINSAPENRVKYRITAFRLTMLGSRVLRRIYVAYSLTKDVMSSKRKFGIKSRCTAYSGRLQLHQVLDSHNPTFIKMQNRFCFHWGVVKASPQGLAQWYNQVCINCVP